MKRIKICKTQIFTLLLSICFFTTNVYATGWKAGTAKTVITPEQPIWMAGYAARTQPASGKIHDLWAKALALEDSLGNRSVLVTLDLLALSKPVSDRIRDRIQSDLGLTKDRIILSSSHTHSGPVIAGALNDIYPDDIDKDKSISRYTTALESVIVKMVSDAFKVMSPVRLYAENGVTRFQVNRRQNDERTLVQQTELKGPNDYAVPVIKAVDPQGNILAIVFGYACHATTLDGYEWCGDYPGFAQIALEICIRALSPCFFKAHAAIRTRCPAVPSP